MRNGCRSVGPPGEGVKPQMREHLNPRERRRHMILSHLAHGKTIEQVAKLTGVHERTVQSTIKLFDETASVKDRLMKAPKRKFTKEVMDEAMRLLKKRHMLTTSYLFELMKEEGHLKAGDSQKGFIAALHRHVKSMGLKMFTQSTKSLHWISEKDKQIRLAYCYSMLEELKKGILERMIFSDEVTMEESPHPKVCISGFKATCWHLLMPKMSISVLHTIQFICPPACMA
jgi:transposase